MPACACWRARSAGSAPPTCAASATRSMRWAPRWWVQMDADFSHDPADAGRLLARVAAGADVAIGSRYVPGGSVDESWGFRRRQLSAWGNRLARWIAASRAARLHRRLQGDPRHRPARRPGAGHNGPRLRLPGGAAAPPACTAARAWWRSRSTSATASAGSPSSASTAVLEFFYHIWWLRLTSHRTFIKFSLTGLSGVVVNLGSFHLLLQLGLHATWPRPSPSSSPSSPTS